MAHFKEVKKANFWEILRILRKKYKNKSNISNVAYIILLLLLLCLGTLGTMSRKFKRLLFHYLFRFSIVIHYK